MVPKTIGRIKLTEQTNTKEKILSYTINNTYYTKLTRSNDLLPHVKEN